MEYNSIKCNKVSMPIVGLTLMLVAGNAWCQLNDTIFPTLNTDWSCHDSNANETEYCKTDNRDVTVFIQSSIDWTPGGGAWNIWSNLLDEYDPTDLNIIWDGTPKYSGSGETDIIYQQSNSVPSGLLGLAYCEDAQTSTKCDQHYVLFATDTPGTDLACHESGHAVGLTHGANSWFSTSNSDTRLGCMRTPIVTGSDSIGAIHRAHINREY